MIRKTPTQITKFLEDNLHRFDTPACYLGGEPNTIKWTEEQWNNSNLKVIFTASFDYTQAVANTTIPLLYQLSTMHNSETRITERCYPPTSHRETELFSKYGIPMFGLETRHCLSDYDVIGVSFNYPLYWPNVVKLLSMSGIPVKGRDREDMKEDYPLVMIGGLCFANPWLMSPVVDIVYVGESEDEPDNPGMNSLLGDFERYKLSGMFYDSEGRETMLRELASTYSNLFIPRFYTLNHARNSKGNWVITGWNKKYSTLPDIIKKHTVHNLDNVPTLVKPPVPYQDPSFGMGTVQLSRSCTYKCGFCAASFRDAPYRERSQKYLFDSFKENMKNTGCVEISPLTLEFGTYSRKKSLMKQCLENLTDQFAMPSLRVDVFSGDPVFGQLSVHGSQTNVTLAIEGNSNRLRQVVSKGITEDDILKAFSNAVAAGYRTVKIYMITDFPGETDKDREEFYQLAVKLDQIRRSSGSSIKVRASYKSLLVESHTPFQWFPCNTWSGGMSELIKKLKIINIGVRIGNENRISPFLYTQLAAMADDIVGEILTDIAIEIDTTVHGTVPKNVKDLIVTHLAKYNLTLDDYFREKELDELFPWDIVDLLVSKKYLKRIYQLIKGRMENDDQKIYGHGFLDRFGSCAIGCAQCGACTDQQKEAMREFANREDTPIKLSDIKLIDVHTVKDKYLITMDIDPNKRYVDKDFWRYAIRRSASLSDLHISFDKFHFLTERIKTIKQWFSGRDYAVLGFQHIVDKDILQTLNPELNPFGIKIIKFSSLTLVSRDPWPSIQAMLWEIELNHSANIAAAKVTEVMNKDFVDLAYKIKQYKVGLVTNHLNLKDVLYDCFVVIAGRSTVLIMLLHPQISPYDAAKAITGDSFIDIYSHPAILRSALSTYHSSQQEMFSSVCKVCGRMIPSEFNEPFDSDYCVEHSYSDGMLYRVIKGDKNI